jgi:choline dehydrogenase-like flavoprotein
MKSISSVDVLIVGSGPVGATFARRLSDALPFLTILIVDGGPRLTSRPGLHFRNVQSPDERAKIRTHCMAGAVKLTNADDSNVQQPDYESRRYSGTSLLNPTRNPYQNSGMPAAATATNVGGMGVFWTGACPRLSTLELPTLLQHGDWEKLYAAAEQLLGVNTEAFRRTRAGSELLRKLRLHPLFRLHNDAGPRVMPVACSRNAAGAYYWSSSESVLRHLADETSGERTVAIQSETLCTRLLVGDQGVEGAELCDVRTKTRTIMTPAVTVVAADALRTPQLLWASGFRHMALGHYLNDHPQIVSTVSMQSGNETMATLREAAIRDADGILGIFCVPFDAATHPYHGQIMHLAEAPVRRRTRPGDHAVLSWFCRKDLRFEDCIEFSMSEKDPFGLPLGKINYELTPTDHVTIGNARQRVRAAASTIGDYLEGCEPSLLPSGSSLHYQGSVRMGAIDDGTSVCDSFCKVWGTSNLFLGGNGVLSSSTAANPTLTSVALALHACEGIINLLG